MPGENAVTLMQAAVVSARFPGILPPFTVKTPVTAEMPDDHWWNFVDGGYADLSGAATALALFNALEPESCKVNVDLKVILLTSSNPPPNFQNLKGSEFRDTMTPVEAIMKSQGFARQASGHAGIGAFQPLGVMPASTV